MRKFAYQEEVEPAFRKLIRLALAEDVEKGDITTQALGKKGKEMGRGEIIVKQDWAVICGLKAAEIIFTPKKSQSSKLSKIVYHCQDGDKLREKDKVLTLNAPMDEILRYERILLNFLQHLSGIATRTREWSRAIVEAGGKTIRLLDTRKTLPGYRVIEKYAVFCGGGMNHRMGLFDQYLIKDNHIDSVGGIVSAMEKIIAHRNTLRKKGENLLVETECRNLQEVQKVIEFNQNHSEKNQVDIIMLDNFSLSQMRSALELIKALGKEKYQVEVSGNMNLSKIKKIAQLPELGIDYISAGALTHSVPSVDLSLTIYHV